MMLQVEHDPAPAQVGIMFTNPVGFTDYKATEMPQGAHPPMKTVETAYLTR